MPDITRRIHFFRMTFSRVDTATQQLVETNDVLPIFRYIQALPASYDIEPNRYFPLYDGNDLLMQVDHIGEDKVRGQFAIKRRTKLPSIESDGQYLPLRLEARQGLAEIFHFVYYPETQLMGVEFNFFAPRIGRWQDYLTAKASHLVNMVETEIQLSGDVLRTLQRMGRKTVAVIGVHRDQVDVLEGLSGSLQRSFHELREMSNGLELQVTMKLGTRRRDEELQMPWLRRLPQFLGIRENREALSILKIFAYDEDMRKTVPVDLLEDSMVVVKRVTSLGENSRAVMSGPMYEAIEGAHTELFGQPVGR